MITPTPACPASLRRVRIFAPAFLLALAAVSPALRGQSPVGVPGNWTLTFQDEFEGTVLDGAKWKLGQGDAGIEGPGGNNPANTTVANGKLTLRASTDPVAFAGTNFAYSTGEISSYMRFKQTGGYMEARMRWDQATGLWPAFWVMPERNDYGTQEWFSRAFLKFNLTGTGVSSITSAKLRVKTIVVGNDSERPNNLQTFAVANDAWTETGINWNNQPPVNPLHLDHKWGFNSAAGDIVEIDVTAWAQSQLAGDGVMSVALADEFRRARGMRFHSRNAVNAADRPVLVLNGSVNVAPAADASVKWGTYSAINYGNHTEIEVRTAYAQSPNNTTTFDGGMELDIMETLGIWGKNVSSHAIHWDGYTTSQQSRGWGPVPALNTDTTYHTYGCYWVPGQLVEFYVDGVKTGSYTDARVMTTPGYLILSLQLGGWDGNNNVTSVIHNKTLDVEYVRVWSGTKSTPAVPSATSLSASGAVAFGTDHSVYSTQPNATGQVTIADGGGAVTVHKDSWWKFPLTYTVTPDTVLEVTVESAAPGEIIALGLENNDSHTDAKRLFHFAGAQIWSGAWTEFKDYVSASGPKTYTIPLGTFYTGAMTHLAIANDNDAGNKAVAARYSNVRIHEGLQTVNFTSAEGYANGTLHGQPGAAPAWQLVSGSNSFTVNLATGLIVNASQTAAQNAVWQTPADHTAVAARTTVLDFDFTQSAATSGTPTIASLTHFLNATSGASNVKAYFGRASGTDLYRIGFYQSSGTPATSVTANVTGTALGLNSAGGDNVSVPLQLRYTLTRGGSATAWSALVELKNRTTGATLATLTVPSFTSSTTFYGDASLYPVINSEARQSAALSQFTITGFTAP
jgi:beta-glucanase (GH16 family)